MHNMITAKLQTFFTILYEDFSNKFQKGKAANKKIATGILAVTPTLNKPVNPTPKL